MEISRLLSDTHAALQRTLAANRILAMMLADEAKAEKMAYSLLRLYQTPADSADDVYRRIEAVGLLPQTPYLETAAELTESLRDVGRDTSLHLLAFEWYGDYSRFGELLRLNPQIRHPNFLSKGEVLNAYAK